MEKSKQSETLALLEIIALDPQYIIEVTMISSDKPTWVARIEDEQARKVITQAFAPIDQLDWLIRHVYDSWQMFGKVRTAQVIAEIDDNLDWVDPDEPADE